MRVSFPRFSAAILAIFKTIAIETNFSNSAIGYLGVSDPRPPVAHHKQSFKQKKPIFEHNRQKWSM
jgi:hypothetical protein